MFGKPAPSFPPEVIDRLGKLIPRLSSEHDGEVTATVAAIGRTLKGAGLDFHDLGTRLTMDPVTAIMSGFSSSYTGSGYTPPRSDPSPAAHQASAANPQREPSPWPTFMRLRHQGRLQWMEAVRASEHYPSMKKRTEWDALYQKMYRGPHEVVTTKEVNLFNQVVRTSWMLGVRVHSQRAA